MSPSSFDDVYYGSRIINKNNSSLKNKNMDNPCNFATRTQEEADVAAATLLAELDTEKLRTETSSKAKKKQEQEEERKTTSSCSYTIEERQSRRIATEK